MHWPCKPGQPLSFPIPSADASSSAISPHPLPTPQILKPADLRVFEQGLSHWWDKVRLKLAQSEFSTLRLILFSISFLRFSSLADHSLTPYLNYPYSPCCFFFTLYYSLKLFLILTLSILQGRGGTCTFSSHSVNRGHDKPLVLTSDQHYLTIYHTASADLLHSNISYHQSMNIYWLHWDHQCPLPFLSLYLFWLSRHFCFVQHHDNYVTNTANREAEQAMMPQHRVPSHTSIYSRPEVDTCYCGLLLSTPLHVKKKGGKLKNYMKKTRSSYTRGIQVVCIRY